MEGMKSLVQILILVIIMGIIMGRREGYEEKECDAFESSEDTLKHIKEIESKHYKELKSMVKDEFKSEKEEAYDRYNNGMDQYYIKGRKKLDIKLNKEFLNRISSRANELETVIKDDIVSNYGKEVENDGIICKGTPVEFQYRYNIRLS